MGLWTLHCRQVGMPFRIAHSQFPQQVTPFEPELVAGDRELAERSRATDLRRRKAVTAIRCLFVNDSQILCHETDGRTVLPKADKLRVMNVTARFSPEYGLRKKSLPPQANQASGVEVLRMEAPDTHLALAVCRPTFAAPPQ